MLIWLRRQVTGEGAGRASYDLALRRLAKRVLSGLNLVRPARMLLGDGEKAQTS